MTHDFSQFEGIHDKGKRMLLINSDAAQQQSQGIKIKLYHKTPDSTNASPSLSPS
jgi:hypothetical protein